MVVDSMHRGILNLRAKIDAPARLAGRTRLFDLDLAAYGHFHHRMKCSRRHRSFLAITALVVPGSLLNQSLKSVVPERCPLYRQSPVRYLAALGDKPWRPCAWHFRHMWKQQMALARQVGSGVGVSNGWIEYSGLHGLPAAERERMIAGIESLL